VVVAAAMEVDEDDGDDADFAAFVAAYHASSDSLASDYVTDHKMAGVKGHAGGCWVRFGLRPSAGNTFSTEF
jgi:hypothetical protein